MISCKKKILETVYELGCIYILPLKVLFLNYLKKLHNEQYPNILEPSVWGRRDGGPRLLHDFNIEILDEMK